MDSPNPDTVVDQQNATSSSFGQIIEEIIHSPLNITLLAISAYLIYRIIQDRRREENIPVRPPPLPRLPKRDYNLEELRAFDGKGPDGRILIAVNGKVFDMTRGKSFYGPGGPYEIFAGRDASRGLGTYTLSEAALRNTHDDLSDLTTDQMNTVKEWEAQFEEKYHLVGRLLAPGEKPTDYAAEEAKENASESAKTK